MLPREITSYFCIVRVLKETPSLAHQDLKDHLVIQAEAMMDSQDLQGHLDHLDLREDHTLETPGTQGVSLYHTDNQISKMALKVWLNPHLRLCECQVSVLQDHQDLLEDRGFLDIPQE